jgi:hypothetical protein
MRIHAVQIGLGDRRCPWPASSDRRWLSCRDQTFDPLEGVALNDTHLVGQVELVMTQMIIDDRLSTLVTLNTFAGEDLNVNDGAGDAGRHAQRGVLNVRRLLAKDRAQQLLFWRQLGFALRRHLANQHVARFNFGADIDNAGLVQA